MSLPRWITISLWALPLAEIAAFILVAQAIGLALAIFLTLATSVLGVWLLRGRAVCLAWRAATTRGGMMAIGTPDIAAVFGAFLLILPGFITDAIGAVLLTAPLWRRSARHDGVVE